MERGQASSRTHQAFAHLHCTLSSEGICHYITSQRVTCKKHLPSSLFRQGASQCRPMLPRANSAIEKTLLSFSRAASAGQPALLSTAPLQGTASFSGQPQQGLAAGCAAGERVPCPCYGAGSSSKCHPIHPPEHHRTGPQSQLIPPWGYRGILPARQPSGTTVHILSLNHEIAAGPFTCLLKTTKPQHPAQCRMGLGRDNSTAPVATLPQPKAGWGLAAGRQRPQP